MLTAEVIIGGQKLLPTPIARGYRVERHHRAIGGIGKRRVGIPCKAITHIWQVHATTRVPMFTPYR